MPTDYLSILTSPVVLAAFRQAWQDSQPRTSEPHEEGGFIVQDSAGNLTVARWPKGEYNSIRVPPHQDCKMGDSDIVASFHTHPNTGSNFLQEPGETDKRAVRDDPDLKGATYGGEFVISQETIYLIMPTGQVRVAGSTATVLAQPKE